MTDVDPFPLDYRAVLAQVPGLTYRSLDHWSRRGYLTPRQRPNNVSGIQRFWAETDVPTLRRVVELVAVGMSPGPAFYVARKGNPVQLGDYAQLLWVGDLS